MKRTRRLSLLAILIVLSLILGACGTSENSEAVAADTDSHGHDEEVDSDHGHDEEHIEEHEEKHDHELTTHDPIAGAEEVRIVAKEWGFEPETIHLHEGEAVNIVLVNEGTLEHEVELEAFDFHIHAMPGETVTAGFTPDETGEFSFACYVPGHYEAGMVGEVAVEHSH